MQTLGTIASHGISIPKKFFDPPVFSQNFPPLQAAWWDDDGFYQFPQTLFNYYVGIGMFMLPEYGIGDNVEIPPTVLTAQDIIFMGYRGYSTSSSNMLQADDAVENITYGKGVVTGWDTDAEQQENYPLNLYRTIPVGSFYTVDGDLSDPGVELIQYGLGVIDGWDTDAEQQIPSPLWSMDLIEERNELPIIPTEAFDTDAEQQLNINTVAAPNIYFGVAYNIDGDLSDTGVEILPGISSSVDVTLMGYRGYSTSLSNMLQADDSVEKIPFVTPQVDFTWDDINEQYPTALPWVVDQVDDRAPYLLFNDWTEDLQIDPFWAGNQNADNLHYLEDRNQPPIIPTQEIDNDSDQQRLMPEYYKDHLSDEGVEKITAPIIVFQLTAWDSDAEQQDLWTPQFGSDTVPDEGIEIIPTITSSVDVILVGYRGYSTSPSNMLQTDDSVEKIPFVTPQVDFTIDNDADQQLLQNLYYNFDKDNIREPKGQFVPPVSVVTGLTLMGWKGYSTSRSNMLQADDAVEKITLNPIQVDFTFDNDAEQQFSIPGYQLDEDVVDGSTEKITLSSLFYDTDADQQFPNPTYTPDDDLSDTGVELITLTTSLVRGWDTDAEQQIPSPLWSMDWDIDNVIEFPLTPTDSWQDDAEQQRLNLVSFSSDTLMDENVQNIILVSRTWDDLNEQSRLMPEYYKDHLMYESLEFFIIPLQEIDNDAEYQFQQAAWSQDGDLTESGVELIIANPILASSNTYDNDAEQQFLQAPMLCDHLSDEGVEEVFLPPFVDIVEIVGESEDEHDN